MIRRTARATLDGRRQSRASSCSPRASAAPARWTRATGHVLFSSIFPDDFDLAGALAGTFGAGPWSRTTATWR